VWRGCGSSMLVATLMEVFFFLLLFFFLNITLVDVLVPMMGSSGVRFDGSTPARLEGAGGSILISSCAKVVGMSAKEVEQVPATANLDIQQAGSSLDEADFIGDPFLLLANGHAEPIYRRREILSLRSPMTLCSRLGLLQLSVFPPVVLLLSPFQLRASLLVFYGS
jgi:hypothetical protein